MKKQQKIITLQPAMSMLIVALSLGVFFSCKKIQPEMSEFNKGCECANEVSADFLMEEQSHNNPNWEILYSNTDTIFANKYVRFTAKEANAEYKWYVGTEELSDKQFVRYFPITYTDMDLPLTLVVKKKPNFICFPSDDGYDSITKYIHVAPKYDIWSGYHPLEGTYRFFAPHLNDSIDVVFDVYCPLGMSNMFDLLNFDGLGNDAIFNDFSGDITYRELKNFQIGTSTYGGYYFHIRNNINGEAFLKLEGNGHTHHFEYKGRKL